MCKIYYYLVLVAVFVALWATMITVFFVMENCGYKAGSVLYGVGFAVVFGVTGAVKPWLKKKFKV